MGMKRLTVSILVLLTVFLSACSTSQADKSTKKVTPLSLETQLPADGVIKKEQLATIVGKEETYRFTGEQDKIRYTWFYPGQQVQNPVTQNLRVTFWEKDLDAIKKQANQAQEALKLHIEKMELAGTPELAITLPVKWSVDKALLVREVKGKLKAVKGANLTLEQGKTTTLKFRVLESDVDYYIVAGKSQSETTKESTNTQTATSEASQVTSEDAQKDTNDQEATTASTEEADSTAGVANDQNGKSQQNPTTTGEPSTTGQNEANQTETVPTQDATVTLSISAKTILNNWDQLAKEKQSFVPQDGWILAPTKVSLKAGDSVYDLLVRTTRAAGIQMEVSWTPMYDAYYIEGINQLYEFDCGGLSGWMFQVNGWFPNYGCSKYTDLHDGDVIKWEYTCDLGQDLGAAK